MVKNILLWAVIAACLILAAVFLFRNPFVSRNSELETVKKLGPRIYTICTNPACAQEGHGYRAHSTDSDWPKPCPKCGQKTLWRAVKCSHCREYTMLNPDSKGVMVCRRCGKPTQVLVRGAEGEFGEPEP